MHADPNEELKLVRKITDGDEEALMDFYDRYAEPLHAFIFHHVNREDAEEIWQDTLLAAIRGMASYHGQSKLYTWLCAIARHKIADFYRNHQLSAENLFTPLDETRNLLDGSPLPEEVVQKRAIRIQVVDTMQMLSDEYRHALVARYADGQGVDEIARQLGRSYKATESLLSRARVAFQHAFMRDQGVSEDE